VINLTNALRIPGWTSEAELQWLAEQASTRQCIVEVGCWKGRSTRALADNHADGGVVFAVDTWEGTKEDGHYKELADKPKDWLYEQFMENAGLEPFVRPLRSRSGMAAFYMAFAHLELDMIFIDGDHSYEAVKADILAWRPLLKPGGLLCGHDFDAGRPGVVQAVRELIPNPRMAGAGSIWVAGEI
jgi:SAM-dependent methyltransferase